MQMVIFFCLGHFLYWFLDMNWDMSSFTPDKLFAETARKKTQRQEKNLDFTYVKRLTKLLDEKQISKPKKVSTS